MWENMTEYYRYLKSEFYKLRHSWFFLIHLLFPISGAVLMLIYAKISGSSAINKLMAFAQIFALACPFTISVACQIAVDQEMHAGYFQNMLTKPNRVKTIAAKFTLMILSGLLAIVIVTELFASLFPLATGAKVPLGFFIITPITLWLSSIFLYGIHIVFSFRFGRNLGISVGVVGSLLSALFQTGLGEGIWYVIPYGVGIRLSEETVAWTYQIAMAGQSEIQLGICSCIIWTSAIIFAMFFWFRRYTGVYTE